MEKIYFLKQNIGKIELGHYYSHLVDIVSGQDVEELKIKEAAERFISGKTLTERLTLDDRKMPMTEEQKAALEKTRKTVYSLLRHVKVDQRRPKEEVGAETLAVYKIITSHLDKFYKMTPFLQAGRVAKLLSEFMTPEKELKELPSGMVSDSIHLLKNQHDEFESIYSLRRKQLSEKEESQTQQTKAELRLLIRQLTAAIDLAQVNNSSLDYSNLINEINKETEIVNARKKASAKSDETAVTETNVAPVDAATSNPTNSGTQNSVV
ncbi:MAG: hypothetical protein EOM44_13700 [Bacteroidia bacterium]|nr:hypothetical protein [Bacteroidia bacterium]